MSYSPMKRISMFVSCLIFCLLIYRYSFAQLPKPEEYLEQFKKGERVLILAPHPDDETIACAGIIQEALSQGGKVRVVYLTNGEHNQFAFIVYEKRITFKKDEFIHMGQVRRKEAIKAMQLLGLDEGDLVFLGYPDFGTFNIFTQYWQVSKPFRSLLTRISSVPYKDSLSFGAPYLGENILADLGKVILDYRPDKIFVSHPADTNVDHKSLYLFLQIALANLKDRIPYPKVYPYLVHCLGWPLPRYYHPELDLNPPKNFLGFQIRWLKFNLSSEQLNRKHKAILAYKSQTESSAFYLLAFGRKNELFGDYPSIDLNNQLSLKEKVVFSLGFSKMFPDFNPADYLSAGNISDDERQVSYAILDKALVIQIQKSKEALSKLSTMVYIFGYSYKKPFGDMPKVRIITKHNGFKMLEGKKLIKPQGVSLDLTPNVLILKIPLEVLGSPDFVLISVKSYLGKSQGDGSGIYATGFRRINID